MKNNDLLSKADQVFLERYHEKPYHYFKEIQNYVRLLEKVTSESCHTK